jgi:hypothetical protein
MEESGADPVRKNVGRVDELSELPEHSVRHPVVESPICCSPRLGA